MKAAVSLKDYKLDLQHIQVTVLYVHSVILDECSFKYYAFI